mmetsp:Transcript_7176/g.23799  ORF Transcript_7176/g.23799 Transcript_7176/m.23799 type:complete len:216 (+) Transcript_7176:1475-2122(+)
MAATTSSSSITGSSSRTAACLSCPPWTRSRCRKGTWTGGTSASSLLSVPPLTTRSRAGSGARRRGGTTRTRSTERRRSSLATRSASRTATRSPATVTRSRCVRWTWRTTSCGSSVCPTRAIRWRTLRTCRASAGAPRATTSFRTGELFDTRQTRGRLKTCSSISVIATSYISDICFIPISIQSVIRGGFRVCGQVRRARLAWRASPRRGPRVPRG